MQVRPQHAGGCQVLLSGKATGAHGARARGLYRQLAILLDHAEGAAGQIGHARAHVPRTGPAPPVVVSVPGAHEVSLVATREDEVALTVDDEALPRGVGPGDALVAADPQEEQQRHEQAADRAHRQEDKVRERDARPRRLGELARHRPEVGRHERQHDEEGPARDSGDHEAPRNASALAGPAPAVEPVLLELRVELEDDVLVGQVHRAPFQRRCHHTREYSARMRRARKRSVGASESPGTPPTLGASSAPRRVALPPGRPALAGRRRPPADIRADDPRPSPPPTCARSLVIANKRMASAPAC